MKPQYICYSVLQTKVKFDFEAPNTEDINKTKYK